MKSDFKVSSNFDTSNICNYCHEKGHWKADCAILKAKIKGVKTNVKPAAFAARVKNCFATEVLTTHACELGVLVAYASSIRDLSVSLVGSDVKVLIKILRDTGGYGSSIVGSVLPLSRENDIWDRVLSCGMGLKVLPVPMQRWLLTVTWLRVR